MTDITWPGMKPAQEHPEWYAACFRNAMRRVAVVINSRGPNSLCRGFNLERSDAELADAFHKKGWDKLLVAFHVADRDRETEGDDPYQAEYFFYCDVNFVSRKGVRVARFVAPEPFLDWGYRMLRAPDGSADELALDAFGGDRDAPAFIQHCATNYLVKNFWHNFVHRAAQGITTENYHQFQGLAREDSDFEADHIANLLLLKAYGLSLHVTGRSTAATMAAREALFLRNRCNRIFAERARLRLEDRASMTLEERFEELEWRFCRRVSNAISTKLAIKGFAVPSVRLFLTDATRQSGQGDFTRFWRDARVIAEVSGIRIDTGCSAYIPDDEVHGDVPAERRQAIRRFHEERENEIVTAVLVAYRNRLQSDPGLKASADLKMDALWARLGVASS